MAAIITDDFRRNSTTFLLDDIKDTNSGAQDSANNTADFEYFIGIGKSDSWDNDASDNPETSQNFSTPLPTGSVIESKEVIDNLIGAVAIKTTNAYNVIPRIDWAANRRYKRWNENDPTMFDVSTVGSETYYPCYVILGAVGSEKIYICLDNNSDAQYSANGSYVPALSANTPTGNSSTESDRDPVKLADGYIWAYVADLNVSSNFNTDQFVSISSTANGTPQHATNVSGGLVYGFEIVNPGSGISSGASGDFKLLLNNDDNTDSLKSIDLTLDITGTGSSVKSVVMSGGSDVSYFQTQTLGTKRASVVPASSVTATVFPEIRPLIAPINGFGFNPLNDLPAFYAGLAVNYNGDVDGELTTSITYRQISLLRNPVRTDDDSGDPTGDGDYTEQEVYNALRSFTVASGTDLSSVNAGDVITDVTAGIGIAAKAFVDYVDNTAKKVYFHQNLDTGINQQEFTTADGTNSKINIGSLTAVVYSAITTPEYTPYTGEVYFLENRKPIQRAPSQEEEIKLVIQF